MTSHAKNRLDALRITLINLPKALKTTLAAIRGRINEFEMRRPHRSFQLTRRRDYSRSLQLPGYWSFSFYVFRTLRSRWRLFLLLVIVYSSLSILFGTMTSQETYRQAADLLQEGTQDVLSGAWAEVGKAGVLSIAAIAGGANNLTEAQQIYASLAILLTWLTTVWLLREILAGRVPQLRDGLYNAGAPLLSTVLVSVYLLIQLIPIGLLALSYVTLSSAGYISEGTGMFLFSGITVLVVALTLYWVTSTFVALVIITLPGMYPVRALRTAGDVVVGRRLRILYRLLWMLLIASLVWIVSMVPLVLFDNWLRDTYTWQWLDIVPFVPLVATLLGTATAVWIASYVYLLYRKVVDDDAAPA